ncbi:hypothetical protein FACS1894147_12790 [Spirochaetia bacterium]|nr:hypothetical protein FACS1894147_12790 [Spirochaetia bacterium]
MTNCIPTRYNGFMKKLISLSILLFAGVLVFAQSSTTEPVPDLQDQLEKLLNKPAMIKPATAAPLGKNWFRLETDAHVITDAVSVKQVAAVLLDLDNQASFFNGKKSKLSAAVVSRGETESIVDFVSISVAPLGIQIKTPYRASVSTAVNTDTVIVVEVRQLAGNSNTNKDIKNLFATRYAEEVSLNGKTYTYIRIYTIDEINASILPGAKGTLENGSSPVNEEILQLLIAAAGKK